MSCDADFKSITKILIEVYIHTEQQNDLFCKQKQF